MKIVGTTKPEWTDLSPFVVHFTKTYDNQISILAQRVIEARNKFGIGRHFAPCPKAVCLSEIPLHLLTRLAKKRGSYGLGFRKEFIVTNDGGPILYAYKDTPHASALLVLLKEAKPDPKHLLWKAAPFFEGPGQYETSPYFFEWEREWRVPRSLKFDTSDVAFLIIPEADHEAARSFFDNAKLENLGPSYPCPLVDPY